MGEHRQASYPHKAGWKPSLAIGHATPPPLSVGRIHYFNDFPSFEAQFLVVHGDMVPKCFSTDHTAIADKLWREPRQQVSGMGEPR